METIEQVTMSATTSRISLKLIQNLLTQDMAQGLVFFILYMFIRGGGGGGGGNGQIVILENYFCLKWDKLFIFKNLKKTAYQKLFLLH